MDTKNFFELVYIHTSKPHKRLVAWGDLFKPRYMTVEQLLDGVIDFTKLPPTTDVYFTPAVLDKESRAMDSVVGASVVWADLDTYNFEGIVPQPLLPPTFVVNSGKGKQMYWVLDKFVDRQFLAIINKGLSKHLQIDSTGEGTHNPNRVLRVPGSNNCKFLDKKYRDRGYTDAYPCEIIEANTDYIYKPNDLRILKPYDLDHLEPPTKPDDTPDRSRFDFWLAQTLLSWGVSDEATARAVAHYSAKAPERSDDYVERTVHNARQFVEASDAGAASKKRRSTKEDDEPVANAEFTPTGRLYDVSGAEQGISVLLSWDSTQLHIPVSAKDFVTKRQVTELFDKVGAKTRIFHGSDAKAQKLYANLVENCPADKFLLVTHAGRHKLDDTHDILVYDQNSAMSSNGTAPDVFWRPDITIEASLDMGDPAADLNRENIATILRLAFESQPPAITQPSFGWLFLNPMKRILQDELRYKFPVLMVYGTKGSGKTTYIQDVLLPFLGVQADPIAAELSYFSIIGHMSYWSSWPTWIDEFRVSNRNSKELEQLCRSLFDRGRIERGTRNREVESYELVGNLLISGEDHWADPANLERSILVHPMKYNIQQGTPHRDAYHKLRTWGLGNQSVFAREYMRWSLGVGPALVQRYYSEGFDMFAAELSHSTDRVVGNLAAVWAGLQLFLRFIREQQIDFHMEPDPEAFLSTVKLTTMPGLGTVTAVDNFVVKLSSLNQVVPGLGMHWDEKAKVLWFNLDKVLAILRDTQDPSTLKLQLEERAGIYIRGPQRIPERGNSEHWGIDIIRAQELGLNVSAPATFALTDTENGGRKMIKV